jgi:hypothetical protein
MSFRILSQNGLVLREYDGLTVGNEHGGAFTAIYGHYDLRNWDEVATYATTARCKEIMYDMSLRFTFEPNTVFRMPNE